MSEELDKLKALAAQQPSLQMLQGALESLSDPVVIVDISFTLAYVNDQAAFVFGYRQHELIGQHINTLLPDTLKDAHTIHLAEFRNHPHARAMKGGQELLAKRKDGSDLKVRVQITPYSTDFDSYVCAQIRVL